MSDSLKWYKSSHSGGSDGNCVEVASTPEGATAVRDSKNPGGPLLVFSRDEWGTFLEGVKLGEFDNA
jgi:uncharacterized protein DUF397